MLNKILKSVSPFIANCIRVILVLLMIIMVLGAGLLIRLSQGPIDLEFAKTYIEEAFSDPDRNYQVGITHLKLQWPNIKAPLLLDLGRVEIVRTGEYLKAQAPELSIESASIGIAGTDILNGHLLNFSVVIDQPTIQIVQKDGSLNLFWKDTEVQEEKNGTLENEKFKGVALEDDLEKDLSKTEKIIKQKEVLDKTRQIRKQIAVFLEQLSDANYDELGALSLFKEIQINQAVLTGEQQYLGIIDLLLRRHGKGVDGVLDVVLPGEKGEAGALNADITYRREQKDLTFTSEVQKISPARFSTFLPELSILADQKLFLNGQLLMAFGSELELNNASLALSAPKGEIFFPEEYEEPIQIENFIFNATLNRGKRLLDISNMAAKIAGIPVMMKSQVAIDKDYIKAPIILEISNLEMDSLPKVFPKSQHGTLLGKWLTERLTNGVMTDLKATTNIDIDRTLVMTGEGISVTGTKAEFLTEGLTVKYSDTLMPVSDVIGRGVYEDDILTIEARQGNIEDIKGKDIKVVLSGVTADKGDADIMVKASGPLSTAFRYIYNEPIALRDDLGFDPEKVKGNVDFDLNLQFPLLKDLPKEEVIVKLDGKITNLTLPNVVKDMSLSRGPFDLSYKEGLITLKGSGGFDGRDVTLEYLQYFDPTGKDFDMKVTASLMTDDDLRRKFGINLHEYIKGPLPIDFVYTEKGSKAKIDIKGDVTPTTLLISSFDYKKPPSVKGDMSLVAFLQNGDLTEIDDLSLSTQGLKFSDARLLFQLSKSGGVDVKRGKFNQVALGKTSVDLEFELTPEELLKVVAVGPTVDISPFVNQDPELDSVVAAANDDNYPMAISLTSNAVFVDESKPFRNAKIYLELDKQSDLTRIEMDAVAGQKPMHLRFRPEVSSGDRTFTLEAENAGAVLDILGVYKHIRGGTLMIDGRPRRGDGDGDLFGVARISDFKVVKVPVLAKLLDAMSVKGAKNILKEDEIYFTKLEAGFQWRFRKSGNLLIVEDGRTSGSAAGLTFQGLIDQKESIIDISGKIIPLSGVNTALGQIPLIGDLLGGKDGALFAATYSLKGGLSDPKVTVNPLSVLAPGFLRRILFEDDVERKMKRQRGETVKDNTNSKPVIRNVVPNN